MNTVLVVLTVIAAILLIIVVLIQKSKGGGLASSFAGTNQVMGVKSTNSFIEKTTWVLAAIILVLSILSSLVGSDTAKEDGAKYDIPAQQQNQPAEFPTAGAAEQTVAAETAAPVQVEEVPATATAAAAEE